MQTQPGSSAPPLATTALKRTNVSLPSLSTLVPLQPTSTLAVSPKPSPTLAPLGHPRLTSAHSQPTILVPLTSVTSGAPLVHGQAVPSASSTSPSSHHPTVRVTHTATPMPVMPHQNLLFPPIASQQPQVLISPSSPLPTHSTPLPHPSSSVLPYHHGVPHGVSVPTLNANQVSTGPHAISPQSSPHHGAPAAPGMGLLAAALLDPNQKSSHSSSLRPRAASYNAAPHDAVPRPRAVSAGVDPKPSISSPSFNPYSSSSASLQLGQPRPNQIRLHAGSVSPGRASDTPPLLPPRPGSSLALTHPTMPSAPQFQSNSPAVITGLTPPPPLGVPMASMTPAAPQFHSNSSAVITGLSPPPPSMSSVVVPGLSPPPPSTSSAVITGLSPPPPSIGLQPANGLPRTPYPVPMPNLDPTRQGPAFAPVAYTGLQPPPASYNPYTQPPQFM